jgi:hypothetical protein
MEWPSSRQKETTAQVAPEEDNVGRPAQRETAPEDAEAGRPQAPAKRQAPTAATTDQVRDPAKGKWLEEVPPTEKEQEKEKKKKKKRASDFEIWEIVTDVKARPRLTGRGRTGKAEEAPVTTASLHGRWDHDHFGRSKPGQRAPDTDNGTNSTKGGANATGGRATTATTTSGRGGGKYGGGTSHDGGSDRRGRTG